MLVKEPDNCRFPEEQDIPGEFKLENQLDQREYLINGEIRRWDGERQEVFSPVCIKTPDGIFPARLGSYPLLTEKESMAALDAAVNAYNNGRGYWPTLSIEDRIKHMELFVLRMKEKRSQIVNLLMWEIGKSFQDSEKEFDRTVEYIINTIQALKELDRTSSRFLMEEGIIGQIKRAPLGVVLCMGPYNYPINETFTTLIPALIMGNTVILKPPRMGVLVYLPLLEIFRDCFPPGVINVLYGEGETVIAPLMSTGKIDVLAFIGSGKVADYLKKKHPKPHRLRCVLGLEAKNAAIIMPDADLDITIKECILGTLSFNGQRCTALKIIFIHTQIADQFIERLGKAVAGLQIGMPWESDVQITPLPDDIKYFSELAEDALSKGAQIINEGGAAVRQKFFYPAVLYPVNSEMRLYREEQFGPVIPVVPFEDIETAVTYLVESNCGQQVSIFGRSADEIAALIDPLVNQVCRVNLNTQCQRQPDTFPFTGRKGSAEGTLSVHDALRVFSIRTLVAAREVDLNKELLTSIVRDHKSNFLTTDFIF